MGIFTFILLPLYTIFFAILAAGLYAINVPISKLLLNYVEPTMMASYLYLGAGIGIGIVFLITKNSIENSRIHAITIYCIRENVSRVCKTLGNDCGSEDKGG